MEKRKKIALPLCFFALIGIFAALLFLLPGRDYSEREKRFLAPFPEFSLQAVLDGSFRGGLEDWLSDHFPLRDLWVGVSAYLKLAEGRNAQQEIYYGGKEHLFRAPAALKTEQLQKNLERFDRFAAEMGVPASLLPVPSPGNLEENLLPWGHGDYPDAAVYQAAAESLRSASLLDPRQALAEANAGGEIYYRTDHHLTAYGSFCLYNLWRQAHGREPRPASDYTISSYPDFYGTSWSASGYWLVPSDNIELWDCALPVTVTVYDGGDREPRSHEGLFFTEHLAELDKYPVYLDGNHPLVELDNPAAEGGTLLIVKDSYAHCPAAFLARDYRTVYLLDLRYYRGQVGDFAREKGVDELLYLYGVENLLTDTNSAWLN